MVPLARNSHGPTSPPDRSPDLRAGGGGQRLVSRNPEREAVGGRRGVRPQRRGRSSLAEVVPRPQLQVPQEDSGQRRPSEAGAGQRDGTGGDVALPFRQGSSESLQRTGLGRLG